MNKLKVYYTSNLKLTDQNYLDCDLDPYLVHNSEDASIYTGHSLIDITKSVTIVSNVQSLFDGPEIPIHQISGLGLSGLQYR